MNSVKKKLLAVLAMPAVVLAFAVTPAYAAEVDCSVSGGIGAAAACAKGDDQPEDLFGPGGIFQAITNVLLFIIGAVSVIMLIMGGIRYTISQGDSAAITSAKNTILYAIVGIVVALLAYAAVNFVITSFKPSAE